jgi:TetR/AcrR family transcriptional regulator, lmrAB and yxaGH operons repressor
MFDSPPSGAGTRARLVSSMVNLLQRRGLVGAGLTEILHDAEAPKGVLYYHFPGGKVELAIAAIEASVDWLVGALDDTLAKFDDPLDAFEHWIAKSGRRLTRTTFERGCPLAAVSLESSPHDKAMRAALAKAFATLRDRLASALVSHGYPHSEADGAAALLVAAYEGGLMQARVAGSIYPLMTACSTLVTLLRARRALTVS